MSKNPFINQACRYSALMQHSSLILNKDLTQQRTCSSVRPCNDPVLWETRIYMPWKMGVPKIVKSTLVLQYPATNTNTSVCLVPKTNSYSILPLMSYLSIQSHPTSTKVHEQNWNSQITTPGVQAASMFPKCIFRSFNVANCQDFVFPVHIFGSLRVTYHICCFDHVSFLNLAKMFCGTKKPNPYCPDYESKWGSCHTHWWWLFSNCSTHLHLFSYDLIISLDVLGFSLA